jgi:TusA-related sulfurtransferase
LDEIIADLVVDITGMKCPRPLIEARRAVKKANPGNIIEFTGSLDEEVSRKEILIALENLKQTVLANNYNSKGERWHIYTKKEN